MADKTTPPRKRFQVHLSTAIILMFAAGGMIWANVTVRTYVQAPPVNDPSYKREVKYFGWPCPAIRKEDRDIDMPHRHGEPASIVCGDSSPGFGLPIDVVVALSLLAAVWYVCERWIAWRSRNRT